MVTTQLITVKELHGDTLTPISIFQRLKGKKKFLLESSLKHEHSGRYSFIGANPAIEIIGRTSGTTVLTDGVEQVFVENALEVLKAFTPRLERLDGLDFPFVGGAVGVVSYDSIRYYEAIGALPADELNLPDVHFLLFESVVVFDHLLQKIYILGLPIRKETTEADIDLRMTEIEEWILNGSEGPVGPVSISAFKGSVSKEQFIENVKRAKTHIAEGDIFQVVLSQRLRADLSGDPFSLYRKLRVQNPSPYMYYFDFEDYVVAGVSPESLVKADQSYIYTNPIAGTRPRGKTEEEDRQHEVNLLNDEKELAEHRMLVDLGRNDLGKVSEFGTVEVTRYLEVERYKHVMHLVSEVKGKLKEGAHPLDALVSCLPAGTVSGAPKIRAMEIINELETVKRGIYSGAVGYYSANGNIDFALAIRTMIIKDQKAYIQAGAGIVYDSIPEKEYEETIHKMKAFLEVEK